MKQRRRSLLVYILRCILESLLVLAGIVLLLSLPFLYAFFVPDIPGCIRSLPSDEAMIENFRAHRDDFEKLAKTFREDPSAFDYHPEKGFIPTPEIKAIMDKLGVRKINRDGQAWLPPDPYSHDAFSKVFQAHGPFARKYSGVIFAVHKLVVRMEYGDAVWKEYYYTPFVPRVRDGKLSLPVLSQHYGNMRIYDTLNKYPPAFGRWDQVFRRIEPQWFIGMSQDKDIPY
ncbi:MAG: hypothetical protein V2B18_16945 [Pseudomonadota bacterium]